MATRKHTTMQAGDDPDENRENQEEPLVPIGSQSLNFRRVGPITSFRRNLPIDL